MFRRSSILHLVFAPRFEGHAHILNRNVEESTVESGLRIQHRMGAYRGKQALIK